ncbi:MAG TPA: DMT family transporter [Candidatus Dormibacteraeota bacterium]|nr:DMT family transporter [Candidatus Dormibacteraeota bacterium]
MGILFGLLTAVTWGASDFIARFATQRIGAMRTMLYMQGIGFCLLSLFLLRFHQWGHLFDGSGWQPWGWGLLAGCVNTFSTLTLYRSFEIGKLSIVAPLSASSPVLTVLLSVLSGERLTAARICGIVAALLGVMLVAGGEKTPDQADADAMRRSGKGIVWALCAAVGFGVLFWLLGMRTVPRTGAFAAVWLIRMTGFTITLAILLIRKLPIRAPFGRVTMQLAGMGVMDTSAFVLNNRGFQVEQISVVSVLASLYGAVTVALAAVFLREQVSKWQWVGIAAIFAGICLISR